MAIAMTEEMSISLQKGLSEWWSEETEYVFQRIERWAAFARGYNRLRSQRLSRGRLTMQEEQEPRWSISSNKIVIEDPTWSPRFHNLKRSHRRKSRADENCKINCCGTFNYQSNSNLDSTCLESYRYDHSIYFKTIGDIKSSKKDLSSIKSEAEDTSSFSNEPLEWESKNSPRFIDLHNFQDDDDSVDDNSIENANVFDLHVPKFNIDDGDLDEQEDEVMNTVLHNVWPIVDLTKLSLENSSDNQVATYHRDPDDSETEDITLVNDTQNDDNDNNNHNDNNNCDDEESGDTTQKMIQLQIAELTNNQTRNNRTINSTSPALKNNQEGITRILSFRKQRRSPRRVRQPTLAGENNVTWPGVLLNYTRNVDSASSPHHHHHAVH